MKKIIIWLMAAFLLQFGVYEYLNLVVLAPSAAYTEQAAENSTRDVSYSYDKSYYAVLSARDLKIFAASGNRQVKDISLKDNESVSYLSWLPDRNLVLAGISTNYSYSTTVTLMAIDPETDSKPVSPNIRGLAKGAKITNVAFSTKTNVTNILIQDSRGSTVYRTDANNYLRRLYLGTTHIDRIASLTYEDTLLYDDSVSNSVYAYYGNGRRAKIPFTSGQPFTLIGTDKSDNIYLGYLTDGNLVSAIYEGQMNQNFSEVRQLSSPSPVDLINVNYDGVISTS